MIYADGESIMEVLPHSGWRAKSSPLLVNGSQLTHDTTEPDSN